MNAVHYAGMIDRCEVLIKTSKSILENREIAPNNYLKRAAEKELKWAEDRKSYYYRKMMELR